MYSKARKAIRRLKKYKTERLIRIYSQGLVPIHTRRTSPRTAERRLNLIRIRLLRRQLVELHKIKAILEARLNEDREKRLELERRELDRNKELERLERENQEQKQIIDSLMKGAAREKSEVKNQQLSPLLIRLDSENMPPSEYHTPDEEKSCQKSRCSTIGEEDYDDLVPDLSVTPRKHPRQSIGQWSVERAKNNMSVRSLVGSLEKKTGPARSRVMR